MNNKIIKETIATEADLLPKLRPLAETDIFTFMDSLKGGTYFNMGMYSAIPVSRAYKHSYRIYKVIDLAAIVSGVSYNKIKTTQNFRNQTGTTAGSAWYDQMPGYENKVGININNPDSKYVLWDIKQGTKTVVRYYIVDISTGVVTPISKADMLASNILTQTEKNKLMPKPVVGFDKKTGSMITNNTVWRTASFDHIFWLSQSGKEYGTRFTEALNLKEDLENDDLFMDGNADCKLGTLDRIISNNFKESCQACDEESIAKESNNLAEDIFQDGNTSCKMGTADAVLSGNNESDRDSGYTHLVDNDLFVDFD